MFEVVIAGGGVAALEAVLALRELAAERLSVTLLAPGPEFVYRPMAVLEPFVGAGPRTLELAQFASETGTELVADSLAAVDRDRRVAHTSGGRELAFDALLVAVGAGTGEVLPGAIVIDPLGLGQSLAELQRELDAGAASTLAFVVPRPAWPLPAYELALLFAERARERAHPLAISILTAEPRPLGVFGEAVSVEVSTLLADAGIELLVGSRVTGTEEGIVVNPGQRHLSFDRIISLPRLAGPMISGLPADGAGFLPVRPGGEVPGVERVFAAGDATNFPVKWGGFAAQQADAAAAGIAALAGADVEPEPFDGVVRGVLIGGRERRRFYFSARIGNGSGRDSRISEEPIAPAQAKLAARYLGPYLDERWAAGPRWLARQLSWERVLERLEAPVSAD